ncbi:MAG: GNAT family N-acetyltransferase [Thermomicrobiales bacterium]
MTEDRIIHLDAADFTPTLRAELDRMVAATFRDGSQPGRVWAPATYHFLLMRGETIIGHVGVHRRAVAVGGRSWAVAGIVKVGVVAALRGHGLGTCLLAFTDDTLRAQGRDDLGLLVTSEDRLGYYGRLGWERIAGPVYYEDRGETKAEIFPVLLLPLRATKPDLAPWYDGPIDLAGPLW